MIQNNSRSIIACYENTLTRKAQGTGRDGCVSVCVFYVKDTAVVFCCVMLRSYIRHQMYVWHPLGHFFCHGACVKYSLSYITAWPKLRPRLKKKDAAINYIKGERTLIPGTVPVFNSSSYHISYNKVKRPRSLVSQCPRLSSFVYMAWTFRFWNTFSPLLPWLPFVRFFFARWTLFFFLFFPAGGWMGVGEWGWVVLLFFLLL